MIIMALIMDDLTSRRFLEIGSYVNTSLKTSLARFSSTRGVNQTPPVDVWNVFLPKPDVPPAIAANYRDVKVREHNVVTTVIADIAISG